jgi:peroxiredoxin (alkyl hydroperoxide reductase subunit C)
MTKTNEFDELDEYCDDYDCDCHDYPVRINDIVPNISFNIYDPVADKDKKAKLTDYRGKWLVVVFYPADFTFVCPTELEELAHLHAEFKKEGAEILSVSTDTVYVHKAWHDHSHAIKQIKYPMAADPTGKLSRLFGTYIEEEGLALRGTFIIDPKGVLKAIEINDNSIGRKASETLRKLRAAKYVSKNPGNVCPASWEPGDDTLKPGMDLVGKI